MPRSNTLPHSGLNEPRCCSVAARSRYAERGLRLRLMAARLSATTCLIGRKRIVRSGDRCGRCPTAHGLRTAELWRVTRARAPGGSSTAEPFTTHHGGNRDPRLGDSPAGTRRFVIVADDEQAVGA